MKQLEGKRILVTGATGLIGKALIFELLEYNEQAEQPVTIMALCRSRKKAEDAFGEALQEKNLELLIGDVRRIEPCDAGIHYIVHGASGTSSRAFVEQPVEIIQTALEGTRNLLELARVNPVEGFVYLSSMEIYGAPATDEKIREDHGTDLDPMSVRSSYPVSKRMCENLCASYASEYGVPAKVIRLTQTFGPGVKYDDGRVFAEFARCVIEGRDIVLHTKGETKRSYLALEDAVQAVLTVLLKGNTGEAYNAANEETYCSILEMAERVAALDPAGRVGVRIKEEDGAVHGYAPVLHMNLDTEKLRSLGWRAGTGLEEMYQSMIIEMRKQSIQKD